MALQNQIQLITYPDSLGQNLADLETILNSRFDGCFGGVHILPFYPSSGDRGFAPLTYDAVDPAFGNWQNLERLASRYDLVYDFMINHLSRRSPEMLDFLEHKDESPYQDMFLRFSRFWPHGEPTADDVARIYKRKPKVPCVEVTFADGSRDKIWCTFSDEQFDLDMGNQTARAFMRRSLETLVRRGARLIRLDAFAFAIKKLGTSCFFLEPEMWDLLEDAATIVRQAGADVLLEMHDHYSIQLELSRRGYRVYDFVLPIMVLHTLVQGDGDRLKAWLQFCPRNQITTLDTHDGMGVVDVKDLLSDQDIEQVITHLLNRGANIKWSIKEHATQDSVLDAYQMNATYYSALGEDDGAYLLARAIQFFTPGIPQVYYVGLLAGRNDLERYQRTGLLTDVNRHGFTLGEVDEACARPVVRALARLMQLRNQCRAFDGELIIPETPANILHLIWNQGPNQAELTANLQTHAFRASFDNQTFSSGDLALFS